MKRNRLSKGASMGLALSTVASVALAASTGTAAASTSKNVTLKIIMWHNDASASALKSIDDAFHKKYPNITVDVVDVPSGQWAQLEQTRLAAKDADIVATQAFTGAATSWAPKANKPGWQLQLDAGLFAQLDRQSFLKNIYPDAVKNASTYKGHVYGVETGSVAYNGVFYNEDIFKQYHLTPPKTWNQFVHIMQVLQSHKVTPFIMGGQSGWAQGLPFMGIFSTVFPNSEQSVQDIWTGKAKFTDPDWVKVYQRTNQLWSYTQPNYLGVGYDQAISYFAQGQAAMLPDGTWSLPNIAKANPKLKFGFFAIPGDKSGANNFLAGKYDLQWQVTSFSSNKDAAMKWLSFFTEPKNYQLYVNSTGFIPSEPGVKAQLPGDAGRDILQLNKHFNLGLDQVTVNRNGVQSGQPGDFFDYNLLKPQGSLSAIELAQQNQKAWDATASLN